jgi:hypothetical protein
MTLIEIQNNFTAWRENRGHPKEKIPDELWQQVATIYSSYPPSIICRRLGLSSQSLKIAMQGDGFASFTPNSVNSSLTNELAICELSLERLGTRLVVKVPMSSFDTVLSQFAGYLPC